MSYTFETDLNLLLALASGEYMSKTKYEQTLQELEEKEGKLFTIPELSNMIKVDQSAIHSYLRFHDVNTFKIRYYKTQRNVTLIPQNEALKIIAMYTSCLPILKALNEMHDLGSMSVTEIIQKLEEAQGRE